MTVTVGRDNSFPTSNLKPRLSPRLHSHLSTSNEKNSGSFFLTARHSASNRRSTSSVQCTHKRAQCCVHAAGGSVRLSGRTKRSSSAHGPSSRDVRCLEYQVYRNYTQHWPSGVKNYRVRRYVGEYTRPGARRARYAGFSRAPRHRSVVSGPVAHQESKT